VTWSRRKNFVGSGSGVTVTGSAGKPISFPTERRFSNAGACSSEPMIPTGTMGVPVSSASRMNPSPNSFSW